jgi:hypothetical protein
MKHVPTDIHKENVMAIKSLLRKLKGIRKIFEKPEILVSALALLLTVFSAASTHKHDRLAVMPKLSFDWEYVPGSDGTIGLFLENTGAGPAVIKSFTRTNEDAFSDQIIDGGLAMRDLFPTYFFQNGTRQGLITIQSENVKDMAAFKRLIGGEVLVTIEYCSIYGDCWKECSCITDPTCGFKNSPAEDVFKSGFLSRIL